MALRDEGAHSVHGILSVTALAAYGESMGPILIFDKSALQCSVWLRLFS